MLIFITDMMLFPVVQMKTFLVNLSPFYIHFILAINFLDVGGKTYFKYALFWPHIFCFTNIQYYTSKLESTCVINSLNDRVVKSIFIAHTFHWKINNLLLNDIPDGVYRVWVTCQLSRSTFVGLLQIWRLST